MAHPDSLAPLTRLQGLPYEACKVTMHSKLLCLRPRFWEQHYFAQVRAATALLSTPWHGCGKHIILEQQQHVPMVSPNSTGMRLAHSRVVCMVAAVSLSTASAPLAAMPMPHGTQSSPVYTCMCVCYLLQYACLCVLPAVCVLDAFCVLPNTNLHVNCSWRVWTYSTA